MLRTEQQCSVWSATHLVGVRRFVVRQVRQRLGAMLGEVADSFLGVAVELPLFERELLAAHVRVAPLERLLGHLGRRLCRTQRGDSCTVAARCLVVVEIVVSWLNHFRRLRVRYDKRADIHEAFLSLGCAWICWQSLQKADDGLRG